MGGGDGGKFGCDIAVVVSCRFRPVRTVVDAAFRVASVRTVFDAACRVARVRCADLPFETDSGWGLAGCERAVVCVCERSRVDGSP